MAHFLPLLFCHAAKFSFNAGGSHRAAFHWSFEKIPAGQAKNIRKEGGWLEPFASQELPNAVLLSANAASGASPAACISPQAASVRPWNGAAPWRTCARK
ncbi:MAG: hypothetical protein LBU32_13860 [Clostridiales bacterium]|nr:hypothetical protein [Clostridiales bacterium]